MEETKSKLRSAIEYRADSDLYNDMYTANYLGTETFRDYKSYIDKIDRGRINSNRCLIHYDGIFNYLPQYGIPKHDAEQWQYWSNLMCGGVDGEIQGHAEFDDNSLTFSADGDGLYVPINYNINSHNDQIGLEIFAQITESTGKIQKILSWKDCIEIWFDDTDGTPKITASTNWEEPGYPDYTLREFTPFPIEIGKPFYILLNIGSNGYTADNEINRTINYSTPAKNWTIGFEGGKFVKSTFNPDATGNFTIGYTGNGTGATPVGDYARMKLYSFRMFDRWANEVNVAEYMLRRFGFRDLMFYDGSIFVS